MGLRRVRVKAAYFDKPSGRSFDNLTPVSTWVDETKTVGQLLPELAKRFWSGVETEVLDDDSHLPQPSSLKAVTVTFNGSLVLKDDNLFDVLSSDDSDQDNLILVGLKGAAEYLPKASTPAADAVFMKSATGSGGWGKHGQLMVALRPQAAQTQHSNGHQLTPVMPPIDLQHGHYTAASSMPVMGSAGKPNMLALTAIPGSNGHLAGDGTAVAEPGVTQWAVTYPQLQSMQILHSQQQDSCAGTDVHPAVGSKRPADRDIKCPLPFLRDISTLGELYEWWETGMDGQKALKSLSGSEYRSVRTRYHEIKNFIMRLKARAAAEASGDHRRMLNIMQAELDDARTPQGAKMGLPSWVRQVAGEHIKDNKSKKSGSQSPAADPGGASQ